jgi:flagellar biosynthesis/type III secretory pathway chaperone
MREPELNELIEILSAEIGLLTSLSSIVTEEQNALVEGDVEGIRSTVEAQMSVLQDIAALEARRNRVLGDLGGPEGDAGDVKLGTLIEKVSGEKAERLREIRSALRSILEAIGTVNRNNGMLINQSLSYIDKTLKMIAGEDASSKVYTADGEVKCRTGQISLNGKI